MRSGPNRRCAGIRTSRVYLQVISPGIYSLIRLEKIENPGSNILNLGSRKFWKKKFENTLLYIIVGSFGSGGGGGRDKFLYSPLVRWETDAIQPSFLPFNCNALWRQFVHRKRDPPTPSQTNTSRPLLTDPSFPTPQNPRQTN
jgi:hypothetical protein